MIRLAHDLGVAQALSALACHFIGVKWSELLFSDLGTDLRRTVSPCFFAVPARTNFLRPLWFLVQRLQGRKNVV
jgi:hypothetical protein